MRPRTAVLAAALVLSLPAAPAAARSVPARFVGVMADGPALAPTFPLGSQTRRMVASGVESVRMQFNWAQAQPYSTWSQVPAAQMGAFVDESGVPTYFGALDRLVRGAAERNLTVLPVVQYPPQWAAREPGVLASPPSSPATYAAFLTALVHRYGPTGTFWSANPSLRKVPIRSWQIWNEPDLPYQWSDQPFLDDYLALLRASHDAVKAVDPHARIVLAGLAGYSWRTLQTIYDVAGASKLFDAVAVHPYTKNPKGVVYILGAVRRVMDRNHDAAKPMLATEVGWPASRHRTRLQYPFETTDAGQASRLETVLPLLAKARRTLKLESFYVYTWVGLQAPSSTTFNYAGLLGENAAGKISAKPALTAFRHAALQIEGCRRKGPLATNCTRRR